ncbi:helix-turn-helix transcriptional regulator [Bacillus pacificus]|uniref:helix-turn-helix transcriptional regulator n=1 Tax=Bacillus cereus group TaxID=86661 RepID=UPI00065B8617|nr:MULTISPECIES: helix-turn-helix transcriptional regulator [Bacillus cereus group]KMP80426.1 transcriptional regulator [Bacillus cereus]MCU5256371.1 helix-turn-helix transcriptional regulator [Bacillus pacificus]PEF56598.1 transcriptional regulator [Bacillus cereus]USL05340.1 helix-turn-helix transcriptional regulator [Bacillus anthracis]WCA21723.1 helix-turn-helix transcriptional regulator [Bacillus paranthracis]
MLKNNMKMYRAAQSISQDELAKLVGVTRQTISALEKNKYTPSLDLAFRICKIFGRTVEEVFEHY